jgi:hypothetical protein
MFFILIVPCGTLFIFLKSQAKEKGKDVLEIAPMEVKILLL